MKIHNSNRMHAAPYLAVLLSRNRMESCSYFYFGSSFLRYEPLQIASRASQKNENFCLRKGDIDSCSVSMLCSVHSICFEYIFVPTSTVSRRLMIKTTPKTTNNNRTKTTKPNQTENNRRSCKLNAKD